MVSEGGNGTTLAGTLWFAKAIALWLYRVMDFTLQADVCSASKSFTSTERSGTGGVFSGTNFEFSGPSSSFLASDKDKYLIVKDNANPRNGGVYRIRKYISDTVIEIDYRAGTLEFPLASTGMSWWICGANYQLPQYYGDYVRLQSRHSTGWAIELKWDIYNPTGYSWEMNLLLFRVATNGNWAGPIIGNFTAGVAGGLGALPVQYTTGWKTPKSGSSAGAWRALFYCEGDYDNCEWLHFMMVIPDTGTPTAESYCTHMIEVARVAPVEAGLPDDDLIMLKGGGCTATFMYVDNGTRTLDVNYSIPGNHLVGRAVTWNTEAQREDYSWCIDHSYAGYLASFGRTINREANRRRGDRLEAVRGSLYVVDPNNHYGYFRILGYNMGHWIVPMLASNCSYSYSLDMGSANRQVHRMTPVNMSGDRDVLIVQSEIAIPWCGLSIIGQGVLPQSLPA
jgi:hypothetical protein